MPPLVSRSCPRRRVPQRVPELTPPVLLWLPRQLLPEQRSEWR